MASTDARPVPRKNVAFRLYLAFRKNDGTLITTWAGADTQLSLDGAAYAPATNEATEIGTSGTGYIDLTSGEMNADSLLVKSTVTNTDALPFVIALYPEESGDYRADVTLISGDATAADNAEAFFDGTGYAGTNNVIPLVTTTTTATNLTNAPTTGDFTATMKTSIGTAVAASAVASVTGNVGGNVTGSVGSVLGGINTTGGTITTLDALDTAQDSQHATTQGAIATAQTSLNTITGSDGVTLATAQANYAPAKAGDQMALVNDAITAAKFDESTAFPLASVDSGATQVARTGADGDTLETLSDEIAAISAGGDDSATIYAYFTDGTRADAFKATGFSTFNHATDQVIVATNNDKTGYSLSQSFPANFAALGINASGHVSRVTLVDTTTTNTDMRGTDGAYTGTPPTAAAIADAVFDEALSGHTTAGTAGKAIIDTLADTNELQTNQGNWLTATGFATPTTVNDARDAILTEGALSWTTADVSGLSTFDATTDGVALRSDGLDSVSTTEPTDMAANFREMLVANWMAVYGKSIKDGDAGTITVYAANGSTVVTTQTYSVVGNVDTVNRGT